MTDTAETAGKKTSCCPPAPVVSGCGMEGHDHHGHSHGKAKWDWMLWIFGTVVILGILAHLLLHDMLGDGAAAHMSHAIADIVSKMWWGVLLGVFFIGVMAQVPQGIVMRLLGTGTGLKGIWRATLAGIFFDLCSHGILMVAMRLYERGASLGQVMAFLVGSPWNSFSLMLILWGLIGFWWMGLFLVLSMIIAVITGVIFDRLVARGTLPDNSFRQAATPEDETMTLRGWWRDLDITKPFVKKTVADGFKGGRIVFRWMLLGVVIAAAIRVFVPLDIFQTMFGPTMIGLGVTLLAATVIEVCSEGSTPIAADIMTRAEAPGNSFAFLMTGTATDYVEIMVLKETTKSWKIALFMPMLIIPQVVVLAIILNMTTF